MRIVIVGASGYLGKKLVEKLLATVGQFEYLIAIDKVGSTPGFINDATKIWVEKNIETADVSWWTNIIESNNITRVYYLESFENENALVPNRALNRRLIYADNLFADYLETRVTTYPNLEVCYMSTDRIYSHDVFPHELNNIAIYSSETKDIYDATTEQYKNIKLQVESRLANSPGINPRLLRVFPITDKDRNIACPMLQWSNRTFHNENINVYGDGKQGIAFTHTQDLIDFMVHEKLFSQEIEILLYARIINFCNVWNYLSTEHLALKLKNKFESTGRIILDSTENLFAHIYKIPQIMNMVYIDKPSIPIEMIIEEIKFQFDPTQAYAPLVVLGTTWEPGMLPTIFGTAEPLSAISMYFGDGYGWLVDTDATGHGHLEEIRIMI